MRTLDRGPLATTHRAAIEQDAGLRQWVRRIGHEPAAARPADELAGLLRWHGDYWERAQAGRFRAAKRALARLARPFFAAQIRYNLLVAEHLARLDAALDRPPRGADATGDEHEDVARLPDPTAARRAEELVELLRWHGDYWERAQAGRFRAAKRALARLARPFFAAQIRYNLLVAEHLARLDAAPGRRHRGLADPPEDRDSRGW